jgi:hypothetical protein
MLEFILSVLTLILFLTVLWLAIYFTIGTDPSGTHPSFITTTIIFIMVLITIIIACGVIWFILNALSFV